MGHPIGHSLSPQMHNAALARLAAEHPRLAGWEYFRFDIAPSDLARALGLFWGLGFRGINLTVPHKVLAVGMVASVDAFARGAGAVNTLQRSDGGWSGFNTDGYGLAQAVREDLGLGLRGARVVVLGAGGAARGAAAECLRSGCAGLWIANRTPERALALVADLAPLAGAIAVHAVDPAAGPFPEGAIIVNATSAGLRAEDPAPARLAGFRRPAAVFDMVYNPPSTRLLDEARALGIPGAHGLGMLAHQGAKALEIWTGVPAAATSGTMRAAAAKALGYRAANGSD